MKKLMLLSMLFLLSLSMGNIRFLDESVERGDELFVHVNVKNTGNSDVRDVRVRAYVLNPDFGFNTATFDEINERSSASRIFIFDVPERTTRGEMWVKVTARDEKGNKAWKYRPFYII